MGVWNYLPKRDHLVVKLIPATIRVTLAISLNPHVNFHFKLWTKCTGCSFGIRYSAFYLQCLLIKVTKPGPHILLDASLNWVPGKMATPTFNLIVQVGIQNQILNHQATMSKAAPRKGAGILSNVNVPLDRKLCFVLVRFLIPVLLLTVCQQSNFSVLVFPYFLVKTSKIQSKPLFYTYLWSKAV